MMGERKEKKNGAIWVMTALCLLVIGLSSFRAKQRFEKTQTASAGTLLVSAQETHKNTAAPAAGERMYEKGDFFWDEMLECWVTAEMDFYLGERGDSVWAMLDGVVEEISYSAQQGAKVILSHENGEKSVYRGLSRDVEIREGQEVAAGQEIGKAAGGGVFAAIVLP